MDNETRLHLIEQFRQEFITIKSIADDAVYGLRNHSVYDEPFRRGSYYPTYEKPYSIGILMQRTIGNLRALWTDFFTTDGEAGRDRDRELVAQRLTNEELLEKWHEAWMLLFKTIVEELEAEPENLGKTIYVNKQPLTVVEVLVRQVKRHSFHAGQIVLLAKVMKDDGYEELVNLIEQSEEPRE